jgi:hypothetical protein
MGSIFLGLRLGGGFPSLFEKSLASMKGHGHHMQGAGSGGLLLAAFGLFALASTFQGSSGRVELDSRQPPKVLPVDGDYPGKKGEERLAGKHCPPLHHHVWNREEAQSGAESKDLPAGGASGIPEDGYWPLDTAHGVTPYFSDPSVVYNANVVDFPYGAAARSKRAPRRQQVTVLSQ